MTSLCAKGLARKNDNLTQDDLAGDSKKKEKRISKQYERLTYAGLAQRDLLPKDNNDPVRFAGSFARNDDTFPGGYDRLDESRASSTRKTRPTGAIVSMTTSSNPETPTKNHGQIPPTVPKRSIQ